jgi:hypothetical protein
VAGRRKLIVEGSDDQHVICNLCWRYGIKVEIFSSRYPAASEAMESIFVQDEGGIDNLLEALPTHLIGSELYALGIVVDADESANRQWERVRQRLLSAGYANIPSSPERGGIVIEDSRQTPRVGVWVMPDNVIRGKVEDFVAELIDDADVLWPHACQTIDKIVDDRLNSFSGVDTMKAKMHTWLAWQTEPGARMGAAITRKYLNADAARARELMNWLYRLFSFEDAPNLIS